MKKILVLFLLFALSYHLSAQGESKNIPISIGLMGHAGWHPGLRIGTPFNIKNWEKEVEDFTHLRSFYISPQIGIYTHPNVHTGYLANVDFGYKRMKSHKKRYSAFAIGLGFLNQAQITDIKVNLSDGSKENVRANWAWFLPTINYELGTSVNDKIGWYGKFSYGLKMSTERENSMIVFLEFGMKYNLF